MEDKNYNDECNRLLEELSCLNREISKTKREIEVLKAESISKVQVPKDLHMPDFFEPEISDSSNEEFEFYLTSYKNLSRFFNPTEINGILPKRTNKKYNDILLRLSLESVREIKYARSYLKTEDLSEEEKKELQFIIDVETKKIEYLKSKLLKKEDELVEEVEEEKNSIILVPNTFGNIRIIDELEHIPSEYYDGFRQLIESIVDGTFKGVKMLHLNNTVGVFEVKAFKIRVVFTKIAYNTYALITAFVKKTDTDKLYRETLLGKIRDYMLIEEYIKHNLQNKEFIAQNEQNLQLLWNILAPVEALKKEVK